MRMCPVTTLASMAMLSVRPERGANSSVS
jgi:hypothetical protein